MSLLYMDYKGVESESFNANVTSLDTIDPSRRYFAWRHFILAFFLIFHFNIRQVRDNERGMINFAGSIGLYGDLISFSACWLQYQFDILRGTARGRTT